MSYALHDALSHYPRVDDLLGLSCDMALCGVPTLLALEPGQRKYLRLLTLDTPTTCIQAYPE